MDVYSRVSSFIGTLFREFGKLDDVENSNVIIITHGLTLRLFLMRWFQYSVEEFESSRNPDNCRIVVMTRGISASTPPLHSTSVPFFDLAEGSEVQRVSY